MHLSPTISGKSGSRHLEKPADDRIVVQAHQAKFSVAVFWGNRVNAIKTQVYCVLIAQLLTVVIRKKEVTKKSFANMIAICLSTIKNKGVPPLFEISIFSL